MKCSSIALVLTVLGSHALFACGGKAQGGSVPGLPTTEPTDTPNEPGDFEPPPPTFETPPPTYETPPPVVGGVSTGSPACIDLCNFVASRSCQGIMPSADELAQCPAACTEAFSEFGTCEDEFGAALSCIIRSPAFDELFDRVCAGETIEDIDTDAFADVCVAQGEAFAECVGASPPGGSCTQEDGCLGCETVCDDCECVYGAGAAICVDDCGGDPPAGCTSAGGCTCETPCDECECIYGVGSTTCDVDCGVTPSDCTSPACECATTCETCECLNGVGSTNCTSFCPQ